jgi:hypothetical protein
MIHTGQPLNHPRLLSEKINSSNKKPNENNNSLLRPIDPNPDESDMTISRSMQADL